MVPASGDFSTGIARKGMRRGLFPCVLSTVAEAQGFQRKIGAAKGGHEI
jgi:hypothetical protein